MKILQVISSYPPAIAYGGASKVAHDISRTLVARGHQVTVFTTDVFDNRSRHPAGGPEEMDGVQVFRFRNISNALARKNFAWAPGLAFALARRVREFDVVHLHEYRSFQAMAVGRLATRHRVPYILSAHGSVLPLFEKAGLKKLYDRMAGDRILRNAVKMAAITQDEKEQYRAMGIPAEKIVQIPNGIDPTEFSTPSAPGTFRSRLGIAPDTRIILYLGRLHRRKGLGFLLDAFARLLSMRPETVLVFAGTDEGCRSKLTARAARLGIGTRVIFTGPLDNTEKISAFVDADLTVYPGVFEIFGLVPLESILCGTPVIVTSTCGCSDVIRETGCGYLITYGQTEELALKMEAALGRGDWDDTIRAGKEYIGKEHAWGPIVSRLEAAYEDCIHHV